MAPGDASQRYLASRAWGAWPRRECLRGDPRPGRAGNSRAATDGPRPALIQIHPRRLVSWNIDPAHPGLQTRDLAAMSDEHEPARPAPGSDDAATQEATGAGCQ